MRFEVHNSLRHLGEPISPFLKQEAMRQVSPRLVAEAREALADLESGQATARLKALLRVI